MSSSAPGPATRASRANPPARDSELSATATEPADRPPGPMSRTRSSASAAVRSSHYTAARPSGNSSTSTRPSGSPSSTRWGRPNDAPPSNE